MKTLSSRRSFLKVFALSGGGMMLGFSLPIRGKATGGLAEMTPADEIHTLNGYIKITSNGLITILSPNPEGGQNVKTSMPMIVADELDADLSLIHI